MEANIECPVGREGRVVFNLSSQEVVNIRYRDNSGATTSRAVEAVGSFSGARSTWFLIGWCRLRRDRRLFRLDGIEQATLTTEACAARDVDDTLGWVPGDIAPLA